MQPPGKGGKTVSVFGPDHMTKVATMPICGEKFKDSSLEPLI